MQDHYTIAIIGGGILGASLAFFLAVSSRKVILIEQEKNIAFHSSGRNTGKVHAPFLYDPVKKKKVARASYLGFEMIRRYCISKSLQFKDDGVMVVATCDKAIDKLHEYIKWGHINGIQKDELKFLDKNELLRREPNIHCLAAIFCSKDGSTNYRALTRGLIDDAKQMGCNIILGSKVRNINITRNCAVLYTNSGKIFSDYVINAAGGSSLDIAHGMHVANEYADFHFRGDYWRAPYEYHDLTRTSVYSVPKNPDYPFLDPHWIIRIDGRREVGPNAVPVFGPYAYTWSQNLANFLPKMIELSQTGARRVMADTQFLSLAKSEFISSLSKTAMINRVRKFLPQLNVHKFSERGTSGIRSSLIDRNGKFLPEVLIVKSDRSLHVLNNNSPGATAALPMAAKIVNDLIEEGHIPSQHDKINNPLYDIKSIAQQISY